MTFIKENNNNLPKIEQSNGKFRITGKSIPLNKLYFDRYLQSLTKKIFSSNKDIILEIDLEITNAYTNKKIVQLIKSLESLKYNNSKNIIIKWYYNSQNESIKELGYLLKNLTTIDFEIIHK